MMDAQTARKRGLTPKNGGTATSKRSKTDNLELVRLLHVMEQDPAPGGISWQQLEARARLCQQLYEKSSNKSLKAKVDAVCHEASQAVANLKARDGATPNPVEKIFKKKGTASRNVVTPEKGTGKAEPAPATIEKIKTTKKSATKKVDVAPTGANVEDLQKQQREQMEAAVAQMASQMKEQTSRLHSTIKGQTDELLDTMENVTSQNVEDVAQVAAATQEQVKRNWRRSAATWTLFFTIVGAFAGTMITIQMVPKAEKKEFLSALCAHEHANKVCLFLSETFGGISSKIQHLHHEAMSSIVKEPEASQHEPEMTEIVKEEPETRHEETPAPETPVPETEEATNEVRVPIEEAANAVSLGDVDLLRSLLEQQPRLVSSQDNNGWGLLHEAAWNGQLEIAELLLEYNCNKQTINLAGKSALDLALIANDGNTDHPMVRLLQDPPVEAIEVDAHGEHQEIKVPDGIDAEKLREEALREFAEMQNGHASEIDNHREDDQQEQIALEQKRAEEERIEQERVQTERQEMQRKFQAARLAKERQQQEEQKENPQAYAMFEGKPFSARDLRRAATRGDVRRIIAYLELKPEILNEKDQNQWTALHLAIRSAHTGVVKALLDFGADTHERNSLGLTPIELAVSKLGDDHEIVSLLEQYED